MNEYLDENELNDSELNDSRLNESASTASYDTDIQGSGFTDPDNLDIYNMGFSVEGQYRFILEEYGIDIENDSVVVNGAEQKGYTAIGETIEASLVKDEPTVVDLNGRVVIMSRDGDGNITQRQPEELFNYSLEATNNKISALHKKADSNWASFINFFRSKDKKSPFDSISEKFENLKKLGPLTPDSDFNEYMSALRDLTVTCGSYQEYKSLNTDINKEPSQLEKDRTTYADTVLEFAKDKLQELDIIAKARNTLSTYDQISNDSVKFQAQVDKEKANEKGLNGVINDAVVSNEQFSNAFNDRIKDTNKDIDYLNSPIREKISNDTYEVHQQYISNNQPYFDFEKIKVENKMNLPLGGNDKKIATDMIIKLTANNILFKEYQLENTYDYKSYTNMLLSQKSNIAPTKDDFYNCISECKPMKALLDNLTYNTLYNFVADNKTYKKTSFSIAREGELTEKLENTVMNKLAPEKREALKNNMNKELNTSKEPVQKENESKVLTNNNNKKSMGGMGKA